MPWGYAAVAVGTVAAGAMSADASKDAAAASGDASAYAAELKHEQFQQSRRDLQPWREMGKNALFSLADLQGLRGEPSRERAMEQFQTSPGYQFRMDQGIEAIERSNAASGRLNSGATLRDLTQFGQGIASQEFNNYANRLAGIAGIGQTATSQTANLGAAAASNQGNALMQAGQARASGYQGSANAMNNTMGNLAGLYGMYQAGRQPNNMQYVNGGWEWSN